MNEKEYEKYKIETIIGQIIKFMRMNEFCRCGHKNIFSVKAQCFLDKDVFSTEDLKCPHSRKALKKNNNLTKTQ